MSDSNSCTTGLSLSDLDRLDFTKGDGLIPAIVQDASTLQVLMLGYMDRAAVSATLETGLVTFFSRSKQRLWVKGESSGNVLRLKSITTDCDQDALLICAQPHGPTCHTGTTSCFGQDEAPGIGFLARLEGIIKTRAKADPADSYTARLMQKGMAKIAQKVGEEGLEVALAGRCGDLDEVHNEAADLLYHLSVLLMARDSSYMPIIDILRERHEARQSTAP